MLQRLFHDFGPGHIDNMPAGQNRSNCAFRNGFLRLATMPTAQSGLKIGIVEIALILLGTDKLFIEHIFQDPP